MRHIFIFAFFVLMAGVTHAQKELAVIHVGNSYSHPLKLLIPLSQQREHLYRGEDINILGATLSVNWNYPQQNKWPEKLAATNKWDVITLLARGSTDEEFAPKFMAEARKGNPNVVPFIYLRGPDASMSFTEDHPIYSQTHGEKVAAAVEAAFPDGPKPRVIPSNRVIRELGILADAGKLPHVSNRFDLFSDGGHLSDYGQYAVTILVSAMLYDESPLDYPSDIYRMGGNGKPYRVTYGSVTVPEETGKVIRQLVWDILQTYEPAGMKPALAIASRNIPPAIAGQPYSFELQAIHSSGQPKWSLSSGKLPEGFTFSENGVLAGKNLTAGEYPISIKLQDEKNSAERIVTLVVNKDEVPSIPEQKLTGVALDQYVFQPLKIEGGVGDLTWSLAEGKLPHGVMIAPVGILIGTPGVAGEYTFKLKVSDSHPAGSRETFKEFTWKIGAASAESLPLEYVVTEGWKFTDAEKIGSDFKGNTVIGEKVFVLDGKPDEPFWNLDKTIEKPASEGTAMSKKISFDAVWAADCRAYNTSGKPMPEHRHALGEVGGRIWSILGRHVLIAVKVMDGPNGPSPQDMIHIYLDTRHDGKIIYGADDMHFSLPRSQTKAGWLKVVKSINPPWFCDGVVNEIEGGFTAEVSLKSTYFIGNGQWLPFTVGAVYGFDIGVDEKINGAVARVVWRGTADNDEDTKNFGTVIITPVERNPAP